MRSAPSSTACEIGVVEAATIDQAATLPGHRGEHAGDRGAGKDRVERGTAREPHLLIRERVGGDDVELDSSVLEQLLCDVCGSDASGGAFVLAMFSPALLVSAFR